MAQIVDTSPIAAQETIQTAPGKGDAARMHALVLAVVMVASVWYMAWHLKRGWVPHDEGTLGLSAERVLQGQLPHRDFDDYTGGLTFVHALAFRIFGINSAAMRYVLFAFFVPWVPAVYYIASRFGSAYEAGIASLVAVAWGVPNYPGPMPSWYNLFFATFGTAALLRYIDKDKRSWLFAAGLCAGISALAKIVAAYFVAAALLFFVFREQDLHKWRQPQRQLGLYTASVGGGLMLLVALLYKMVHKIGGISGLTFLVLPSALLAALLLAREVSGIGGTNKERFSVLFAMCLPFAAGLVLPLIVFLIPYARAGAIHDLYEGLLAGPRNAKQFATFVGQNPATMLTLIPFMLLLLVGSESKQSGKIVCGGFAAAYCSVLLFFGAKSAPIYSLGWCALGTCTPLLVAAAATYVWQKRETKNAHQSGQRILLLTSVVALCSLIQFPFANPIYFFYIAPLTILLAAGLSSLIRKPPRLVIAVLAVFLLVFPQLPITRYLMGLQASTDIPLRRLGFARGGGLNVDAEAADVYNRLIPLVQEHGEGRFIFASPDCPEIYFFSGYESPTRFYFDYAGGSSDRAGKVLQTLDTQNVNLFVINRHPQFSKPLSEELLHALEGRYPHDAELGQFEVRWKK